MRKYVKSLLAAGALAVVTALPQTAGAQGFSATEVQLHQGDGYLFGRNVLVRPEWH